jgi:regulator of chromosome condensation
MTGGVHHSLFLFSNGQVWACGRCDGFETGLGAEHPAMVESKERETVAKELRRVRREQLQVELEAEVDDEGGPSMNSEEAALKAAEAAAQGVPLPNPYIPLPTQLSFPDSEEGTPSHIISIAAGTRHNFAVSSVGQVFAWGVGNTSQLGLGAEEEAEVPTRVKSQAMEEFKIVKASTGGQHSVVVGYRA